MSRDTSSLYSGQSNAASKLVLLREAKAQEKQQDRQKLEPAADLVLAELRKDKAMLGELLLAIVDPNSPDDQIASKLAAVRLHREWMTSFENRMKKILRRSLSEKKAEQKASKEFGNG